MEIDSDTNPESRRRFPRRQFRRNLGLLFGGSYIVTLGHEIGEGGMLLESELRLVVGRQTVLSLFVYNSYFMTVKAEILYEGPCPSEGGVSKYLYGIRFTNLAFEAKRSIRDYIAEKSSKEAKREKAA